MKNLVNAKVEKMSKMGKNRQRNSLNGRKSIFWALSNNDISIWVRYMPNERPSGALIVKMSTPLDRKTVNFQGRKTGRVNFTSKKVEWVVVCYYVNFKWLYFTHFFFAKLLWGYIWQILEFFFSFKKHTQIITRRARIVFLILIIKLS